MLPIQEHITIAPYTTFRAGGTVRYFIDIEKESSIPEACLFAQKHHTPIHILGGGSNTIFRDGTLSLCVLHMKNTSIQTLKILPEQVYIELGAGTNWDNFVHWSVKRGYNGAQSLSGIPGTAGAAPIQNIGAYGQELKNILAEVRVYDTQKKIFVSIPATRCNLEYRTSIFKQKEFRGKYIIVSLVIKLSLQSPTIPAYEDIQQYCKKRNFITPSLIDIRTAILETRAQKIPDPSLTPNVGSFFKNPLITIQHAQELQRINPNIKLFSINSFQTKVFAGWLIEQCGFNNTHLGPIGIYEKNALVLTNTGQASYKEIKKAQKLIQEKVQEKFSIALETEPDMVE